MNQVLEVRNLSIEYRTGHEVVKAVRALNMMIPEGEIVGLVGESGSGKSSVLSALIRLLSTNADVTSGEILFDGADLLRMTETQMKAIRGTKIAVILQDPMTSLNPVFPIGTQMLDIQYRDKISSKAEKRQRSIEMLRAVGIPDPAVRISQYPHEFSGGMRQRIAIAMALLCDPRLLIADEPTTALDVTMEAQILHLLRDLRNRINGSILFISHNLGAIAEICDRVLVMYAGEIVEAGPVHSIFHAPQHPYTRALLECDPARLKLSQERLPIIPGEIPNLAQPPTGCAFAPRCREVYEPCLCHLPPRKVVGFEHQVSCHR